MSSHLPVSKERIFSFDGIQKGDYIVGHLFCAHHYLVEEVSPDSRECTVIESWRKKVQRKTLNMKELNTCAPYYRLHYDEDLCLQDVESVIENASQLVGQYLFSRKYVRKRIVHYLKTDRESDDEINLTDIPDRCLRSPDRECTIGKPLSVVSINNSDLGSSPLKRGDHIIYKYCISDDYAATDNIILFC